MKYNNHLIVIGSARSGTSWVSELIAGQYRYRLLFEPEHPKNTKKGILLADKLITKNTNTTDVNFYLKKIFANRVDCNWIAQNSNRKYKRHLWPFIPKKYIIKFVRCNLSSHYINENFQIPILYIVRNPYDVIHSQMRVKFPWLFTMETFINQPELVKYIKNKFDFDIANIKTFSNIEILTLRWCIENIVPLKLNKKYNFKSKVVKFEELKENIELFIEICEYFNLTPVSNLESKYRRPSSKMHPKSNILNKNISLNLFKKDDLLKMNAIFDIFKMDLYPRREL